jgi:hypothetical protein
MEGVIKERDQLKKELDDLAELNWQLYDKPGAVQDIKAQAELEEKMWEKESRITELNHYIYMDWLRLKGSQ